jgi:hypothetical protein
MGVWVGQMLWLNRNRQFLNAHLWTPKYFEASNPYERKRTRPLNSYIFDFHQIIKIPMHYSSNMAKIKPLQKLVGVRLII